MTYIIAEIGNNHNGSCTKAKELIDISAQSGVDAVKIQSMRGSDVVIPSTRVDKFRGWENSSCEFWCDFVNSISLSLDDHQEVIDYAHSQDLDVIATPLSAEIVSFLETLNGIDQYKVASMDLDNEKLLRAIVETGKLIVVSTGMGSISEVENAIKILEGRDVSILHCVSDYPPDPRNGRLQNITVLRGLFPNNRVGFSDHSLGHELAIAAVALGAEIIEKHVTLDRNNPDLAEHHFSLEPRELADLVNWIRILDGNLAIREWARSSREEEERKNYRRSFYFAKDLPAGHIVTLDDLLFLRPGGGLGYAQLSSVFGKSLAINCQKYEKVSLRHID